MKTHSEIIAHETWYSLPDCEGSSGRAQRTPAEFSAWGDLVADAIARRDVENLIKWTAHGRGFNDGTKRAVFKIIGQPLPRNIAGIKSALYAWAGVSTEQQTEIQAHKDAARNQETFESDLSRATYLANQVRFRIGGALKTGVEAVNDWLAQGYNQLRQWGKPGAVPRWSLANPSGTAWPISGPVLIYARLKLQQISPAPGGASVPASLVN